MNMDEFMPHGFCMLWIRGLIYLHCISDLIIAVSYFTLAALLWLYFSRETLPYKWIVLMFSYFIFFCGATHVMSIIVLWQPVYWAEGLLKAITAMFSAIPAIYFWKEAPIFIRKLEKLFHQEKITGKPHEK